MCRCKSSGFLSDVIPEQIDPLQDPENDGSGTQNNGNGSAYLEPVAPGDPEDNEQIPQETTVDTSHMTALQIAKMLEAQQKYIYPIAEKTTRENLTSWIVLLSSGLSALFLLKKLKVI